MQEESVIRKGLVFGGEVSLAVLDTTALVNEAIRRHNLTPVAAAALGRTLTAAAYLCSWLKEEESSLSVTVEGGGVGGKLTVAGDGALNMRGYCECPDADLPLREDGKLDVGGFVGKKGTLTVIRDDGEGIPFVGTSALVSGEIAEDFSAYFLTSEQRPTAIALGVKIGGDGRCLAAGGVFLQPLPGASEAAIDRCEREIGSFAAVSSRLETAGAAKVFAGIEDVPASVRAVRFRCHCNRARVASLILSLGREEAEAILAEQGEIRVHCHYCNTDHTFGKEEIEAIFRGDHERRYDET